MRPSSARGPRHLESALEATCEALIALQLIEISARDEQMTHQARLAIGSLRRAVAALRQREADAGKILSYGFVLGDPGG